MQPINEAAAQFLSTKRIAVTGVSRTGHAHGANTVFKRLRDRGSHVFAVNPNAAQVEDTRSYPDIASIPAGVEAVVIGTAADKAEATMRECVELGITRVWMHRAYGPGSVSDPAAAYGREHGVTVIDGGCPLMFGPTADLGHKALRMICRANVPRTV